MKGNFVSAQGPGIAPSGLDVRFLKSVPDFKTALKVKRKIDAKLAPGFTTVIYRLFYDSSKDEFYSSRQFTLVERGGGNELFAGEPPALAYELFSTPKTLLNPEYGEAEPELSTQVGLIFNRSNTHRPGSVQP
jgi:hypothetical protein